MAKDRVYLRLISNSVRLGCGFRVESNSKQFFAFYGEPFRNDDYFYTAEITETEYQQLCKEFPHKINVSSEAASAFRSKYISGHTIILEGWGRLPR